LDKCCVPIDVRPQYSDSENEGVFATISPLNVMESILGAALMKTADAKESFAGQSCTNK